MSIGGCAASGVIDVGVLCQQRDLCVLCWNTFADGSGLGLVTATLPDTVLLR